MWLGTALLRHHQLVDVGRVPAVLIASNTRTHDLYAQHGDQRLGDPFI